MSPFHFCFHSEIRARQLCPVYQVLYLHSRNVFALDWGVFPPLRYTKAFEVSTGSLSCEHYTFRKQHTGINFLPQRQWCWDTEIRCHYNKVPSLFAVKITILHVTDYGAGKTLLKDKLREGRRALSMSQL